MAIVFEGEIAKSFPGIKYKTVHGSFLLTSKI